MSNNKEDRADLAKGILAGGLTLIGLSTGSGPLFTLLVSTSVGVGGNLLANVVDRAIDNWTSKWFSREGVLSDHISRALRESFSAVLRELEKDWKKNNHYHYLIYQKQQERAALSLTLLRELRENTDKLLQDDEVFAETLKQEMVLQVLGREKPSESQIHQFLNQALDQYLGAIEPLAEFAKRYLASKWLLGFSEIIRSKAGTAAWRACQQLWQASLMSGIIQLQQSADQSEERLAEVQNDLATVKTWLSEWGQNLAALPSKERNPIGDEAFERVILEWSQLLEGRLGAIKADTELIISLLRAYPNNPEARKAIKAQAKCRKAM